MNKITVAVLILIALIVGYFLGKGEFNLNNQSAQIISSDVDGANNVKDNYSNEEEISMYIEKFTGSKPEKIYQLNSRQEIDQLLSTVSQSLSLTYYGSGGFTPGSNEPPVTCVVVGPNGAYGYSSSNGSVGTWYYDGTLTVCAASNLG